jgi:hypothetical protein
MWAGYLALANQDQVAKLGSSSLGFGLINSIIYPTGAGSGYGSAFHDIISGNNDCCGQTKWYSAVTGYDLVTGWGSPNGAGLITALEAPPTASVSPTSLTLTSTYNQPASGYATLTNNGPGPLLIQSVQVTGSYFSLSGGTCTANLYMPPGQSCTAQVTYDPGGCYPTTYGQLAFYDNGTAGEQTVSLTGKTLKCTNVVQK